MGCKADVWFSGYLMQRQSLQWKEFVEDVCTRFGERKGIKKLTQSGTVVEDYQEKFEELKALLLLVIPNQTKAYFASSFISGLKVEIVTQAANTSQAFEQSRLQEMSLEALFKSKRNPFKNLTRDLSTDSNHTSTNPFFKSTSIIPPETNNNLGDSGSKHSFLDPRVVKQAHYNLQQTVPMEVTVANGHKMLCQCKCPSLKWQMQGYSFEYSPRLLNWGPIELKGVTEEGALKLVTGKKLQQFLKKKVFKNLCTRSPIFFSMSVSVT
ncbi:hypothetical protein NMG60_11033398 [Bertholletia excelsa]